MSSIAGYQWLCIPESWTNTADLSLLLWRNVFSFSSVFLLEWVEMRDVSWSLLFVSIFPMSSAQRCMIRSLVSVMVKSRCKHELTTKILWPGCWAIWWMAEKQIERRIKTTLANDLRWWDQSYFQQWLQIQLSLMYTNIDRNTTDIPRVTRNAIRSIIRFTYHHSICLYDSLRYGSVTDTTPETKY